jgi:Transposase DDE domain
VRHTRSIQHDRSQRNGSAPSDIEIAASLKSLVEPATFKVAEFLKRSGKRERTLGLSVMLGIVLSLIWRQLGSVCMLARVIERSMVLWVTPRKVTQQAINQRLRSMPAEAFEQVLIDILPPMIERWKERTRPVPETLAWAAKRYARVLICDGSTLDALIRKIGLLKDYEQHPLAGRMLGILDMVSKLPVWVGFSADADAHDQRFWPEILAKIEAGALLVFDMGYINYLRFAEMTRTGITFVTRAKDNLVYRLDRTLERSADLHDQIVWIGNEREGTLQRIRLVELLFRGKWYRYISNELDADRLPAIVLVDLYRQRWRVEDAFNVVKSLLGLSYFHCAAENAIRLQVWATWILYAVLVDLTDAVAEALQRPIADISMEMVYRSIQFYPTRRPDEPEDLAAFLAHNHKSFGLIKRKKPLKPALSDSSADAEPEP